MLNLKKIATWAAIVCGYTAVFVPMSRATIGTDMGNGGDICEDRFKIVRDDIATWIGKGGSAELTLPRGVTLAEYGTKMLDLIAKAQISCGDDKVMVGNGEKTCKNYVDPQGGTHILCNNDRFLKTTESDQYILVHHEFAGLIGIEMNDGENSNYSISNQISGYLENQVVKKLAIKPSGLNLAPGETVYSKLSKLFNAGTLPNLELYVGKAAIGRCFSREIPNSPLAGFYSIQKKIEYAGPISGSVASYSAMVRTELNDPSYFDNKTVEQILADGHWGNSFLPLNDIDERTYSALSHENKNNYFRDIRMGGDYLILRAHSDDDLGYDAYCYYFIVK